MARTTYVIDLDLPDPLFIEEPDQEEPDQPYRVQHSGVEVWHDAPITMADAPELHDVVAGILSWLGRGYYAASDDARADAEIIDHLVEEMDFDILDKDDTTFIICTESGVECLVTADSAEEAEEAWDADVEDGQAEPRSGSAQPASAVDIHRIAAIDDGAYDYR